MNSIPCPLQSNAQIFPNHPAIIDQNKSLTYQEFHQRVCAMTDYLAKRGIKPNDRVDIVSQNSAEYLIMLLALWRIKAVACLLSTRLPQKNLKKQIKKLRCQYVLTLRHPEGAIATEGSLKKSFTYSLNQPTTIIFTSGTSGEPKAAVHTFGNHYFSAKGSNEHIPFKKGDRWLLSLPLYHVGGLSILFRALLGGGTVVIADPSQKLETNIHRYKITHVSVVPTQLYRLLQKKPNAKVLKKLKAILVGGSSIPELLLTQSKRLRLPIYISYGLTEMSSQVATSEKLKFNRVKILNYREFRISKEGEILVKGKTLFKGYIKGKTIELALDHQGWFHTGDLGRLTKGKYLSVIGRKDNMFISGGENIQPEEIEKYLLQIPGIEQAIVVPVKSKEFGFRPVAFIKRTKASFLTNAQIIQHLKNHLPKFKIPDQFLPWPNPLNKKNLKLNRKILSKAHHRKAS